MITFFTNGFSPFARKVAMALEYKSLAHETVDGLALANHKRLLAVNPRAEVPVLVEDDGAVISGAYAICEYLEEKYPQITLLGHTHAERAEVRRIVAWFDHKFDFEVTQNVLFEKSFKQYFGEGEPDSARIRLGKHHIHYHLDYIGYLASSRYFLAGETLTLADIAAASHLSALDYIGDVDWNYNQAAHGWYALMKSRPSLRSILIERVRGVRPPAYYEDPDF